MRKMIIGSCLFVLMCVITNVLIIPNLHKNTKVSNIEKEATSNIVTYIVKDFNGNIAVYESNSDTPFKITDVPISSMPKADQEMLKSGISVKGENELESLLEDLCS